MMTVNVCVYMFTCQLKIAERVADEFFEQGDMERKELNLEPIVSTDCHHGNL